MATPTPSSTLRLRPHTSFLASLDYQKGQSITVAYSDPTEKNDAQAVQDQLGNDAASFNPSTVTNKSKVLRNKPTCGQGETQKVKLKKVDSGYLYGIDDDNQIFEINPQKKTTSKVFDTGLPNPRKSNGVAYHKATQTLLFFYEQTLYSWDAATNELTKYDQKKENSKRCGLWRRLWWIKSNTKSFIDWTSAVSKTRKLSQKAIHYQLTTTLKRIW